MRVEGVKKEELGRSRGRRRGRK
jgi:hypothetical protein